LVPETGFLFGISQITFDIHSRNPVSLMLGDTLVPLVPRLCLGMLFWRLCLLLSLTSNAKALTTNC
jgi:hypothetical protein